MGDSFINQYIDALTEDEKRQSEAIYQNYKENHALTDDMILEGIFHGNASKVAERMKELDDIHVKAMSNGKFQVSRYSEERRLEEGKYFNELRQQNEELKKQNEELRNDFNDLKNLIIEKLK